MSPTLMATARKKSNLAKATAAPRQIAERYEVEGSLGKGGGGNVYLARDLQREGQRVAVKVLESKKAQDPTLGLALQNEFAALTLLRHRNLARVFDFGTSDQISYFSSEWIDGEDIVSACQTADFNTVFRLLIEVLRGVDYLHRRGVLHLDLKPANILVTHPESSGERSARLIDFGVAEWKRRGMQNRGEFSGTPPYAAPELILGQAPSPASDIYSLGMLFHQIFTQGFPFATQDPNELLQIQIYKQPQRAEGLHAALPESFSDLLLKMVAREPHDRFASTAELLAAINLTLEEKFSLRSPTAPARILEESDHLFHKELLGKLKAGLSQPGEPIVLTGPEGVGKTHLLNRLKETLQLEGQHPLFFSSFVSLETWLKTEPSAYGPLLLDFELGGPELERLASLASDAKARILAATRTFAGMDSLEVLPLQTLQGEQILEFLRAEIAGFPGGAWEEASVRLSQGVPKKLEVLLQAWREVALLTWGEQGWRWNAAVEIPSSELLPAFQARWAERQRRVVELLKLAPVGLSAQALAGILGIETATLESRLEEWATAGVLLSQERQGTRLYSPLSRDLDARSSVSQDWGKLADELETMYDRAEYGAGARLSDLIFSTTDGVGGLPEKLRIFAARHYLASGQIAKAGPVLPSLPPIETSLAGLFWEVFARFEAMSHHQAEAFRALDTAESLYLDRSDRIGLSRVNTLRGWVLKKSGDAEAALACYEKASEYAAQAKDFYTQGLAELNRGTVYHDQGKLDAAQAAYSRALELSQQARHPLLELKLQHNLVNLFYTMGRASEAEQACYELLRLAIRQHDGEEQAAALNYLSLFAGQRGDPERERVYLDQAIELLTAGGSSSLLPQFYFNRAYLNWDQKKFPAALIDVEAALSLAERNVNLFTLSWSHLLKGKILRDRPRRDFAAALRHFETANQMIHQQNNQHLFWEVEFDLGLLAKKQDQFSVAKNHFESARRELEAILPKIPEALRRSYLRDRKLEKIDEELNKLT